MARIVITVLIIALFSLNASESMADLRTSIGKFKETTVPPSFLAKIASYDYLVQYFTSFAFFEPHHRVSPEFIHALILAESSGNPEAVSSDNALGLGQIIFTTGRPAAEALSKTGLKFDYVDNSKLQDLKKRDLLDPAINILLTCYLIAKYNYKFDGKLELVVSAWNAGEYTKSLQYGKHAAYRETEELIGKVNGYYIFLLKNR